jgi:glycine betaine/choline ABC-type transport system substrate-binding protein
MALRKITFLVGIVLLAVLVSIPAQACFGPKLFVGAGSTTQQELLYAIVTLYVQEKTGVESTRVEVGVGQNPLALLTADKVDLVFVPVNESVNETVFQLSDLPPLVAGSRPVNDLQFTTVLPAVAKLNRLLTSADVELLVRQVEAGKSAMSVARKFLMEKRWI